MSSGEGEDVCKDGADVAALFRAGEYRRRNGGTGKRWSAKKCMLGEMVSVRFCSSVCSADVRKLTKARGWVALENRRMMTQL